MIPQLPIKMPSQKTDCRHKTLAEAVWDVELREGFTMTEYLSFMFPQCFLSVCKSFPHHKPKLSFLCSPNILQLLLFAVVKDCHLPTSRVPSLTFLRVSFSSVPSIALSHLYCRRALVISAHVQHSRTPRWGAGRRLLQVIMLKGS